MKGAVVLKQMRQTVLEFMGALLVLAVADVATACPEETIPSGRIKVTMVVILGSEEPGKTQACLRDLAKRVQKQYPNLKSFRVESMSSESMAIDTKTPFKLVEKKSAFVTIHHGADNNNKVKLSIHIPECLGEIVYRSKCGPFLPIVTCYQTEDGKRLILAVRVEPCKGK